MEHKHKHLDAQIKYHMTKELKDGLSAMNVGLR